MKNILLILGILLGNISFAFAQLGPGGDAGQREQKIQALYVAYITRELKLTEAEAQKFWPVHTEFDTEMKALRTEKDVLKRDEAILNLKKKYQDRFTKILGAERTNIFYRVDTEFRKKMIERLQKLKEQNNFRQRNKAARDPNWN